MAAKGYVAVLKWAVTKLIAVLKQNMGELRAQYCANADRVYYLLKSKGASVPKQSTWDKLSCDQKVAFVFALGPYGSVMVATGALAGGFVTNAAKEMKKYGGQAAKAVNRVAASLGNAATRLKEDVNSWGKAAEDFVEKLF